MSLLFPNRFKMLWVTQSVTFTTFFASLKIQNCSLRGGHLFIGWVTSFVGNLACVAVVCFPSEREANKRFRGEGRIQNMDPGPWTTHEDPVHGPPRGPGPWTTPVDWVHGSPHLVDPVHGLTTNKFQGIFYPST